MTTNLDSFASTGIATDDEFFCDGDEKLKNLDDEFILSKFTEKYPDFSPSSDENMLKQAFSVIIKDSRLITDISETYELSLDELFGVIYRNYSFIFSGSFMSRIRKLAARCSYVRNYGTRRDDGVSGKKTGKRRGSARKA